MSAGAGLDDSRATRTGPTLRPALALGATLSVQTLGSMVLAVPSVIAPAVAPALGIGAEGLGIFVGVAYLAAMLSGLASGRWVVRLGAVSLCRIAMVASALGAWVAIVGGSPALLLAASLIGFGYGVINPASTSLLGMHAPDTRRALIFSIKQTGVPLGVALAGLSMPWGLHALGWQPSVILAGVGCMLLALLLRPAAKRLEPELRTPGTVAADASADSAPGVLAVLRNRTLLRLSLMSFAFAFTQLCFVTFLVSYLNLALGRSLAVAAAILAGAQLVSTIARIAWGYVADRWVAAPRLLGALGLLMGAACIALALLGPASSNTLITLTAAVCAATAMGWNGVYFAELSRHASQSEMAAMAGASQFFTFSGSMSGPVVFAAIVANGGSYAGAYAALAALPALAGVMMLRAATASVRPSSPRPQ